MADLLYLFEDYVLDTDRHELRRGSEVVPAEPQVFDVLTYLIENRERVVTREDLLASVWEGRTVSESTLSSRINAARVAVGDSGDEQRLIRTVLRRGFRFVGPVRAENKFAEPLAISRSFDASEAVASPDLMPVERPEVPLVPVDMTFNNGSSSVDTNASEPVQYRPLHPRPSKVVKFIGAGMGVLVIVGLVAFFLGDSPVIRSKRSLLPRGQTFDASTIPLITDADRRGLANYLDRPDPKAVAIAYDAMAVVDSAATFEDAKRSVLELCQARTRVLEPSAFWPGKVCKIYALGPDVVWSRDAVPLPAPSDLRVEPLSIQLVPNDVPLVRGNSRRNIADQYMKLSPNKALAITTNGLHYTSDRRGRAEAGRMAVEGCAVNWQRPCLILSIDGFLTVQIPQTRTIDRIFLPSIEMEIPSPQRERIVEVYRGADWRAVATGKNGKWEAIAGAASEAEAIDAALKACARVDNDCSIHAISNFHVARE